LMGIFGEGGTGKTRMIQAVRTWFEVLDRRNELVITATTGTAAFKIKGNTLHSAVGIPIEFGDNRTALTTKVIHKKASEWRERRFLIADEVSMMDAKVLESVNKELIKI